MKINKVYIIEPYVNVMEILPKKNRYAKFLEDLEMEYLDTVDNRKATRRELQRFNPGVTIIDAV